ncbi:MAG: lipoyl-dependent peroxiredoxin [Solirubrobacteraceae bacterium]|jgi:osmotically inducible protein OsmC|nr:lipoyl-dependent peroxiredoxin [Solirubrobacteraceae bacterium]
MPIAGRRAETIWEGTLAAGHGTVRGKSGAIDALPVTWDARTKSPDGKTSPEDLAAAAHSACFAMALALRMGEHSSTVERLNVAATVTLDDVDGVPTIVSSALEIGAEASGLDEDGFQAIVQEAADLCPVSRLFAGAEVSVHAQLR